VRQVDLGAFRHRLVASARQVLALPRPPVIEQRRDDPHGELLARDVVGVLQQGPCGLLLTTRLPVIARVTPLWTAPFMRLSSILPLQ
jgi:CBS domain containing-hemolysin-like protein